MSEHNYPNLHGRFGWPVGVHRAPAGYEHPWLAVLPTHTVGCWTRQEARNLRKACGTLAATRDAESNA